jgi:hypothetical protein
MRGVHIERRMRGRRSPWRQETWDEYSEGVVEIFAVQ